VFLPSCEGILGPALAANSLLVGEHDAVPAASAKRFFPPLPPRVEPVPFPP